MVKIASLNCRGLASDKIKRRDFFNICRSKYDISILVDTHCDKNVEKLWKTEWGGEAVFASYNSQSRGIAILFRSALDYKIYSSIIDKNGNFLFLKI